MTGPRAADDFPPIRERMHELRRDNLSRPRADDDSPTIRARIDELRRERAGKVSTLPGSGLYHGDRRGTRR
jgi:hypothetical protein